MAIFYMSILLLPAHLIATLFGFHYGKTLGYVILFAPLVLCTAVRNRDKLLTIAVIVLGNTILIHLAGVGLMYFAFRGRIG
jgi:hypothetical protein